MLPDMVLQLTHTWSNYPLIFNQMFIVARVFEAIKVQLLSALYMYVLLNSVLSNKQTLYQKYFYGPKVVEATSPVVCYV